MTTQANILLSNTNYSDEDIDILIKAANDILTATEADFKYFKDKKWYNRFLELITFSKDGEKVIARSINSLSKMQDIMIRVLLMISKDQRKAYDFLEKNSDQLLLISRAQKDLAINLKKIKYEYEPRLDIQDVEFQLRSIIIHVARKFADHASGEVVEPLPREYLNNLQKCSRIIDVDTENFKYEKIDLLDKASHQLLAMVLCEVACLIKDSNLKTHAFEDVINFVGISPNYLKAIQNRVEKAVKFNGREFIASYYEVLNDKSEFLILNPNGIEFDEIQNDSINSEENSEEDYFPGDDSLWRYWDLRMIIYRHLPDKFIYHIDENGEIAINKINLEKARNFINKNNLNIVESSLIAFIDTTIFGGAKEGILLTTSAIYHRNYSEEAVGIRYLCMDRTSTKIISISKDRTAIRISGSEEYEIDKSISFDILSYEFDPNKFARCLQDIFSAMDNLEDGDLENLVAYFDGQFHPYDMGMDVMKPYLSLLISFYLILEKNSTDDLLFFIYFILCSVDKVEGENLQAISLEILDYFQELSPSEMLMELKQNCIYPSYSYVIENLVGDCHRLNYNANGDGISIQANDWLQSLIEVTGCSDIKADKLQLFTYVQRIEDDSISNDDILISANLLGEMGLGAVIGGVVGWFALPLALIAVPAVGIFSANNTEKKGIEVRLVILEGLKEQYKGMETKLRNVRTKHKLESDEELNKCLATASSKVIKTDALIIKYKKAL